MWKISNTIFYAVSYTNNYKTYVQIKIKHAEGIDSNATFVYHPLYLLNFFLNIFISSLRHQGKKTGVEFRHSTHNASA